MNEKTQTTRRAGFPLQFGLSWGGFVRRVARVIFVDWSARQRQRARLREMTADQLRDIGVSREEAAKEGAKPCWR